MCRFCSSLKKIPKNAESVRREEGGGARGGRKDGETVKKQDEGKRQVGRDVKR